MNNKLKCVKPFFIQNCDDDGFLIENKYTNIKKDSIQEQDSSSFRMVVANDSIRLDNEQSA